MQRRSLTLLALCGLAACAGLQPEPAAERVTTAARPTVPSDMALIGLRRVEFRFAAL